MLNIGIDAIEIERFSHWRNYSKTRLSKIFAESEIDYCLSIESKSAERFASHFAAKEAFYKALSRLFCDAGLGIGVKIEQADLSSLTFLKICKLVKIDRINKIPILIVDWPAINFTKSSICFSTKISLTHSKFTAVAVVVILNN